jgi:mono/diheme cytochrome c family protein
MYRGLIQDEHFLTEELRDQVLQRQLDAPIGLGRIWRVKHSAGTDTTVPELATASPAALVQLLGHDNGWVRDTAQRLLLRTPGVATGELKALAVSENSLGALHALWALQGRSELNRETTLGAFSRDDYHRQVQALRAGRGLLRSDDLLSMAESSAALAPAVRMQLAFALGDHAAETQVRVALLQLLATDIESAYLRQAVVRAARGEENEFLAQLLADALVMPERESVVDLVKGLAVSAYNSNLDASADMLQLLAMVQAQSGERQWLQLAMLEGFRSVTHRSGFTPVSFAASPPIFTDSSIEETNPLWPARLKARRAFTWPGDELAAGITPLGPTQLALQAKGAAFYPACGACHGQDGGGIAGLGPALTDSARVNGAPEHLGRIILQGLDTERNGVMPPHNAMRELDDETLAGLMLYLRRSWGNSADPVSLEMTASIRQASSDRTTPWTVAELDVVEVDRGYDRFEGKYKISFITMTVTQEDGALHLSVPMYGGGPLQEEAEGVFSASLEGESLKIEFQINEDGSVPAFVLYRDGQKIPVPRI